MKNRLEDIVIFMIGLLFVLIVLAFIGLEIFVWVKYGNKTINEIPAWALWLMFGGGD